MVFISYMIKAPKAVLPLTFILIIFVFSEIIFFDKKDAKNTPKFVGVENNSILEKGIMPSNKFKSDDNDIKPTPISLTEKSLKPKPLTFDTEKNDPDDYLEFVEKPKLP